MEHVLRVELQEQTAAVLSMRNRRACCHGMLTSAAEQLATLVTTAVVFNCLCMRMHTHASCMHAHRGRT